MPEAFDYPINVARPFLPPEEEFIEGVRELWKTRWLTNHGPITERFADQLREYLGVSNITLFTNGTLALQTGLQTLGISGEVITTPFTFVATSHAVVLSGLQPVFVDIEPDHFTIDPDRIEAAITSRTSAILAVHVYGQPCQLRPLQEIAERHRLKLIYDAAHAFGTTVGGESVCRFGDLTMLSFHATKLFHTIEGGALVYRDAAMSRVAKERLNFGILNETDVPVVGTNAKMTEFQALMGQLILPHVDAVIEQRTRLVEVYREQLSRVPGIEPPTLLPETVGYNYAYMPVQVHSDEFGMSRDELYETLKRYNVFARRYFYPIVPDLACYRDQPLVHPLPVARAVAERILCLPLYTDLTVSEVAQICDIVKSIQSPQVSERHLSAPDRGQVRRTSVVAADEP